MMEVGNQWVENQFFDVGSEDRKDLKFVVVVLRRRLYLLSSQVSTHVTVLMHSHVGVLVPVTLGFNSTLHLHFQ